MKYCANCGYRLSDSDQYCGNCGSTSFTDNPEFAQMDPVKTSAKQTVQQRTAPQKPKKNRIVLILFIILLVVIIFFAAYIAIYLSNNESEKDSTNSGKILETVSQESGNVPATSIEMPETAYHEDSSLAQKLLFSDWKATAGENSYYLTIEEEEYGSLLSIEILDLSAGDYLLAGSFYIDEAQSTFCVTDTNGEYSEVTYQLSDDNTLQITLEDQIFTFQREA